MSETSRRKDSKIVARRRRVFELRCIGYKIPQIVEKLAEEGRRWHENTIKSDLHSVDANDFLEELQRQQFADVALTKSRRLKLEYRDRMIERLTPRKSPDVAVNNQNNIQVKLADVNVNATVQQLLKRHREFVPHLQKNPQTAFHPNRNRDRSTHSRNKPKNLNIPLATQRNRHEIRRSQPTQMDRRRPHR